MNEKTKKVLKKILIVIVSIAVLAIAFLIFWKATEHDRFIKREMKEFSQEVSNHRNGVHYDFHLDPAAMEDPTFVDFLKSQISDMFENDEYILINHVLSDMEYDAKNEEILDLVTDYCKEIEDLKTALWFYDMRDSKYYYYNLKFLNRNSGIIASYIEENGTKEITTTPGEGYYADKEDSSSRHTVGLSGSPLYDAISIKYLGDFMIENIYGVELNRYYEETSYSYKDYYFRDNDLTVRGDSGFTLDDGECVYSGDYLFFFSENGDLILFSNLNED